jgi:hypothetical protein
MTKPPMSRWKAAAIHLVLSAIIIGAVAFVLIHTWYTWQLFEVMGARRLLTILAIIDIVIGPFLTLIVYKHGKKSLKFDLTVIALLQAGFLAYGLHILAQSRPVFMVGLVDRFEMVFANQLDDTDLAKGNTEEFRTRSWTGPRLVGGALGSTSQERYDLALSGLAGKDIHLLPEQYVSFEEVKPALMQKMEPAEKLAGSNARTRAAIEAFAAREDLTVGELSTLPIISLRGRATMMLRTSNGDVLGPLAVEPWPDLPALPPPGDAARH